MVTTKTKLAMLRTRTLKHLTSKNEIDPMVTTKTKLATIRIRTLEHLTSRNEIEPLVTTKTKLVTIRTRTLELLTRRNEIDPMVTTKMKLATIRTRTLEHLTSRNEIDPMKRDRPYGNNENKTSNDSSLNIKHLSFLTTNTPQIDVTTRSPTSSADTDRLDSHLTNLELCK
uniref:Uncharacterized protein n=1 Tax=Lactuca sativa TaxID=4236 RepID=A0A9R1XQN0_LACSA|nr:hypothetical protein LSAT_V11C200053310 [Lactuca sativa]